MIEEMREEEIYYDIYKLEDLIDIMKKLEEACEQGDIDEKANIVEQIELLYGIPTFEDDVLYKIPAIYIDEECKVSLYLPIKIPY